jgi:hypothetical protein
MNTFSKASVRNTQPFILRKIVRLNSRLTCRDGVSLCELAQFGLKNSKFRGAAIQADNDLGGHPHRGPVNVSQPGEMDANLRAEFLLVD